MATQLLKIILGFIGLLAFLIGAIVWAAIMTYKFDKANKENKSRTSIDSEEFDFVVVGLGAGGSVIASRLSEVPNWTVLAIDGGPHEDFSSSDSDPNDQLPPYSFVSPHDPVITSLPLPAGNDKIMYIPRFNGLGGTGRLYGGINTRPSPAIMRRWPANWTYDDLLPYYKKVEDHYCYYYSESITGISAADCRKYHGQHGPLQVNPTYLPEFANVSKLFEPICKDSNQLWGGYNSDINGRQHLGCSLFQRYFNRKANRTDEQSDYFLGTSFHGYFQPSVISRANLRIRSATIVTKILFDTGSVPKAIGIVIQNSTSTYTIRVNKEVILAGGAFSTPHLLQVSGVGDPSALIQARLPFVAANYHVGKNLRDHVAIPMVFRLKEASSTFPNVPGSTTEYIKSKPNGSKSWIITLNTGLRQDNITDLQIYFSDTNYHSPDYFTNLKPRECRFGSNGHKEKPAEITLRMILQDPSFLGTVVATSDNIHDKPIINFNWKSINEYEYGVFNISIKRLRDLVTDTDWGNLILDEIFPGIDVSLKEFIDGHLESALHPISTCQMGLCCDTRLRVYNISQVRVSDASAFGGQVDANPSATIFALAERLADILKDDYGVSSEQRQFDAAHTAPGSTVSRMTAQNLRDYSTFFPQGA
jgi:choline dehydrogenase